MTEVAKLAEIYIYPIKSLPGIRLEKAIINNQGLVHPENPKISDRKWMIVDEKGAFRTQRQLPRMALIKQSVEKDAIVLSAPNKQQLRIPLDPPKNNKRTCRVWDLHIEGYSYGGEHAKWLSEFLEVQNLDLVSFSSDLKPRSVIEMEEKQCHARENDKVIYEDYSPFMLLSEASLNDLNSRLTTPVTVRNFRPNFFVTGCGAYGEDEWVKFKIGSSNFTTIKICTRCVLTTVHPDEGVKDPNQEPLKTLKEYRMDKEAYGPSPKFGINIATDNQTDDLIVSVGDKITIEN